MTDKSDLEAEWRAEFERDGKPLVYEQIRQGLVYGKKRRVAFQWLMDESSRRRARVFRALELAMWMLVSIFGVIIIGAVAIVLILTSKAFGCS